jgi:hypothetical protein
MNAHRPFGSYLVVGVRETLPPAAVEYRDQLTVLRGEPDKLYLCRLDADGLAYEWVNLHGVGDDGVLAIEHGGTGEETASAAFWALAPAELFWLLERRIEAIEMALLLLGIDTTDDAWVGVVSDGGLRG